MLVKNPKTTKNLVAKLLSEKLDAKTGNLLPLVKNILSKKEKIINLANKKQTPFFIYDCFEAQKNIAEFKKEFQANIPNLQIYYALKSDHCDFLVRDCIKAGLGLDVSSGRELQIALKNHAKKMVFSGPGKSEAELKMAIANRKNLILHLDSPSELKKVSRLLTKGQTLNCGVRIFTEFHGNWNKFGIALNDLKKFFNETKKYPQINLMGLQCHMSFNESAKPYQNMIRVIAKYLKTNFTQNELAQIKFFDFGGGYYPNAWEGFFPWESDQGRIIKIAADHFNQPYDFSQKYYISQSASIKEFAQGIGQAIKKEMVPLGIKNFFCEPGRIISTPTMHIALRIADLKNKDMGIADGGNNMIGTWERFEDNYYPLVNLTHPSLQEKKFALLGNLCTPADVWGYYMHAKEIKENDLIIIPFQGAYNYSLTHEFIKPIPSVYELK